MEEKHRLRVFENRVLRKVFGPQMDDITRSFVFSTALFRVIKSRRMRWSELLARMGDRRGACKVLVGRPDGKT
jgi:hypothetical protein